LKKSIKTESLIKIAVVILVIGGWGFSGKVIYDSLSYAARIDPALVESHRPRLNTNLVRQADEILSSREEEAEKTAQEIIDRTSKEIRVEKEREATSSGSSD